jgi:hypothetical protein
LKKATYLKVAVIGCVTVLTLYCVASIAKEQRAPLRLRKINIVGEHRVDTSFFPGVNARWQHDHYRFVILPSDTIVLSVKDRRNVETTFKRKLVFVPGPPDLWQVIDRTHYHLWSGGPTLYRGHHRFYYVFRSRHYGNMFFRKIDE